ncbi:protein ANTAGONIST OF LIKE HETEROCHROMATIN PROTEIN 1-like isoform X2 [Brachypodium distachyon]|uniref:protein ANTAGONIST OF LIKE HETEROCHROMATIN PROTEIN 1-like isoform X2 n=1 Tax=Brachypodium distachyon TaxID=15368 RepID=UPI00052FF13A|nr:protein ANTAGONIST OF LIKE HETEROCHROMATIN PROTEIN 1-like isoform X2 [Brachypodium distachyon]|eukprot:XP_003561367.2 protein ANTAGONIST OF LIKE HETEROCHROMATIN PROTEIN 1-like isoform X2 [Brachypodium distachyon]
MFPILLLLSNIYPGSVPERPSCQQEGIGSDEKVPGDGEQEEEREEESGGGATATEEKTKKGKRKVMVCSKPEDSGKVKRAKPGGAVAALEPDLRGPDTEWWYAFLSKHKERQAKSGLTASVPSDEEEAFRYFFRTSRSTFDYVCSIVRDDLISRPPSGLINIEGRLLSVEKQVAIAMRRLASGDSQVSVGAAFGVGQSTVSQVTWRFIESMEERARHHLVWPDQERMDDIKANFEVVSGLPNCCGAIDATHIVMMLPAVESSEYWYDHANNYSMFLQGIVDHEMRFIDVVTGWPGSTTFSQLLKLSEFYKLCEAGKRLDGPAQVSREDLEIREFIVGDVSYPLLPWLMTPYQGESLSALMVDFNARQKAARMLGTRALARLKGSWRILQKVMWRPDKNKLPSIILVCCLLHNIMIDRQDQLLPSLELPEHHDTGYTEVNCQKKNRNGKVMREVITEHLPRNGVWLL